jgi:two-component sensor histidine kinase
MDSAAFPLDRKHLLMSWRSWTANDLQRVGPGWLQWVWTLLFCLCLALFFTALGAGMSGGRLALDSASKWAVWYGRNLVVCLTIGGLIHLMFDASRVLMGGPQRVRRLKPWQRSVFFAGVPMLGVAIGWPVGIWLSGGGHILPRLLDSPTASTVTVLLALSISLALHFIFAAHTREIEAERRATEAQLRLLQAQIEPHFLFNTLANVVALIEIEPAKAKTMLGAFTDYLRTSLGSLRRDRVPLSEELALAEAYLRVQQSRMEDRLRWQIDADETARRVLLPPLLLQPLVENAIQHGLEPSLDGGTVNIRAWVNAGVLMIEVHDTGRGPSPSSPRPGNGVALANVRERLQQRHADRASLQIAPADPGTRASLRLPIEADDIEAPQAGAAIAAR